MRDTIPGKDGIGIKSEVHTETSSYTANQTEVKKMIAKTGEGWAGIPYELFQGCIDYNDPKKGPPQILFKTKTGEILSLSEYQGKLPSGEKVESIHFVNKINITGLRPGNLVLTDHPSTDNKTMGTHGRGTKVAATAALAGDFASAVTVQSYAEGIGTWQGEFKLVDFQNDIKQPRRLALDYKIRDQGKTDETVISIHNPNDQLVTALLNLPDQFLYADEKYPGNVFTGQKGKHYSTYQTTETDPFSPTTLIEVVERPSYGLLHSHLFVDGLKVRSPGRKKTALQYHISNPTGGYPERSNDSLSATKELPELVVLRLMVGRFSEGQYFQLLSTVNNAIVDERDDILENTPLDKFSEYAHLQDNKQILKLKHAYLKFKKDVLRIDEKAKVVICDRWESLDIENDQDIAGHYILKSFGVFFSENLPLVDPNTRPLSDIKKEKLEMERKNNPAKALLEKLVKENANEIRIANTFPPDVTTRATVQSLAIHLKNGATFQAGQNNQSFIIEMPDVYKEHPVSFHDLDPNTFEFLDILAATEGLKPIVSMVFHKKNTSLSALVCGVVEAKRNTTKMVLANYEINDKDNISSNNKTGTILKVHAENKENLASLIQTIKDFLPTIQTNGQFDPNKWIDSPYYSPVEERLLISEAASYREKMIKKQERLMQQILHQSGLSVGFEGGKMTIHDWGKKHGPDFDQEAVCESYCKQYQPGTIFGLSKKGIERGKSISEQGLTKEQLRKRVDFLMLNCDTPYLLITHAEARGSNYSVQGQLERRADMKGKPTTVVFNKPLRKGTMMLPVPSGYKPVEWYHKDPYLQPLLLLSKENGQPYFTLTINQEVPKGLAIIYEKDNLASIDSPSQNQKQQLCLLENLQPYWKNLISFIRDSNLDDSQKLNYLLQAWNKNFSYTRKDEYIKTYKDLVGSELVEKTINLAAGDCGYCSLGFRAILSLAGIPNEEVIAQLSEVGAYGSDTLHSMASVYVDNRWVLVEPQDKTRDTVYAKPVLDKQLEKELKNLLHKIPEKKFTDHSQDFSIPADLFPNILLQISEKLKVREMFTRNRVYKLLGSALAAATISFGASFVSPSVENNQQNQNVPNESVANQPTLPLFLISYTISIVTSNALGVAIGYTYNKRK